MSAGEGRREILGCLADAAEGPQVIGGMRLLGVGGSAEKAGYIGQLFPLGDVGERLVLHMRGCR